MTQTLFAHMNKRKKKSEQSGLEEWPALRSPEVKPQTHQLKKRKKEKAGRIA
jgi:hypothetical protein